MVLSCLFQGYSCVLRELNKHHTMLLVKRARVAFGLEHSSPEMPRLASLALAASGVPVIRSCEANPVPL